MSVVAVYSTRCTLCDRMMGVGETVALFGREWFCETCSFDTEAP